MALPVRSGISQERARQVFNERPLFAHSCHCIAIAEGPESAQLRPSERDPE
jgi:hypothetical protein